jgi:hypothetical protein
MVGKAREFQALVEKVFAEGVAKGEFRRELNPKLAMLALLGLCNSVIGAHSMPRAITIEDMIDEYCRIVIDGIRKTNKAERQNRLSNARNNAARRS